LLYINGIPETTNPAEIEFGARRFRQFLAEDRCTSADQLADRLPRELSEWSACDADQDLHDDITLVAIHAVGG
jgi:serine phosphatase RsbU (regulator of sigma subunit)